MAFSLNRELSQVLFEEISGVRKVILNRPKKLNSLNYEMVCQMLKKLKVYENDPKVKLVILKGNGKAFCAGGDVTATISYMTIGEYLGLTGARLDGNEMIACGLATHFILSKDLVSLENALHEVVVSSDKSTISQIIDKFDHKVNIKQDTRLEIINKCFSKETVEEILSSLENFAANQPEKWIIEAINSMKSASPTSLKLFLKSIREGRMQKLEQCLVREFNILCHILRRTINDDFYEGSRAMLIDKDKKPKWQPSKLELVSEEMVGQYFSKVDDDDWEPLHLPIRSNLTSKL
ncbi:hypothetical protein F0562_009081 [Nyssa sinensis]|uniref:3-hydroxyisobutyryl-CoA hydrolase n=1 Tax=Nyssa sinensis TaxID=561372 RepID=A0A5J5A074_9ASTE|nr:hypothetical protein F0562_009081 [Nyssa sinensis]